MLEHHPAVRGARVFGELGLGVVATVVLHVAAAVLCLQLGPGWSGPLGDPLTLWAFSVGLNQVLYVLPAAVVALLLRRTGFALGLAVGAALTFLLQGACYGFVASPWFHLGGMH